MRRATSAIGLLLLVACSTPPIRLSPLHEAGQRRVYALAASTTTIFDAGAGPQRQHTELEARSAIEVLAVAAEGVTMRVTLTPSRYLLEGRETEAPGDQVVEVLVAPDGTVLEITSVGGVPADIVGTDLQELAPLLGAPLPTRRVRLGDTWNERLPPPEGAAQVGSGSQSGRVAALRVVGGYDCAIVSLATRRPLVRERSAGDQTVRLSGTETSATEIAFAFREGFPVRIHTVAEGRFTLQSGSLADAPVTIETVTDLRLVEA